MTSIAVINIPLKNNENMEEELHELTASLKSDYKGYIYVAVKINITDNTVSLHEAQSTMSLSDIMRSLPITYTFVLWDSSSSIQSSCTHLQQIAGHWPIGTTIIWHYSHHCKHILYLVLLPCLLSNHIYLQLPIPSLLNRSSTYPH